MELRHLRYFVAIAEEQSFTRAAERLWVAQPGLSTQIRRLEEELGVKLFARHTRGVALTDAGAVFLERARAALAAAEECRATGKDLESGVVGTVRLGITTDLRWHLVPALLTTFGASHPGVELIVVESHGGTLLRDLRDGRLDALFTPAAFSAPELQRANVGAEPWAVLVGPGHQLADGTAPLSPEDLDGEAFVVTGHRDGAGYDRAVTQMLSELGVSPVLHRGGPGPALFSPVVDGEALGLSTRAGAVNQEVVCRSICPEREVSFDLAWRDDTPAPALREFIRAAESFTENSSPARRPHLALAA
jgi:DNA-binding transcriptional LysR family regulator